MLEINEDDAETKERTKKDFDTLSKNINAEVRAELEKIWDTVYREAIALCPVDSGALVGSIVLNTGNENMGQAIGGAVPSPNGGYAISMFNGTITAGDSTLNKHGVPCSEYAALVHDGHGSYEGVPFLAMAIDAHEDEIYEAISKAIDKAANKKD